MKTFIKPVVVAVMLLLAGSSFAQTSHPPVHYKHHKHHKHHKKIHHVVHHAGKHQTPPPPHQ